MDMFEDECQRASWRRHGAIACGVAKRGLVAFLAFAMAFGTTPAQLWAEGADGIAEAVAQAATGSEGAAADDDAAAGTGANSAAASAAADDAGADQGATASAANGDGTAADNATESENSAAASAASEQKNAVAAASATTLSSEAKVFIQDTKDKDSSYSTKSGALSAGDTLWANMYDEVEDDWYGTSTESVANPGTWTYTWLAGTTRASSNVADYTEVVGHEQSLTVTAAMEGKYFICKVTVDGKDYYGPSVSSGSGINANYIPGPVLGAGQMELNSVKLNSDTPSIGDTLTATPYISYYQQAPANAKVAYTWSASTSQYSGFTKIEGETGASLTVTDDLEGKYIRVEANAGVNTVNKTTSSKVKQAGAVEISAVSIVNTKDNTSVFTVGDTAKARAKEKGGAYGAFVDADKLNFQWQSSDTKSGAYTDIAGATGETLELTDALGGKYLKCKVSSKIGSSSLTNSTGALVAAAGSINVTSVTMSPTSGKVEVGSTITATAKAGSTDVTSDSHVTWRWYKGKSNTASSCNTPIEGETGNTLTVTAALKGYYVVAKANGGYGEQKPCYAAGPVSVAGQVELYDVQFEGSPATNGVRVGDTLKTKVRKKDGSNYHYIDRTDNVTYQWQYANSSSSYDSAYTDIPGATEATYTVDAAYAGKYLRVKVTSENTVSSTQKKSSYGGTQSVAPLGPVTLKGQYKLAGIELADKNVTLSVGSKITPSVQVPGSWSGSTKDVPDDAELTMAWYAKGEGDADWTELTDGIDTTDGSLTISDALVGKRIKVTANALDNTVEWVSSDSVTAAGEYNLLRVIANPQINSDSTHLVSGDSVKATAQAKRADGSTTNGIDVTGQATVAWYAADDAKAPEADWTLLSDMSGAEATVSASAAGKYLKAVATSGSSTVELVSANPVIAAGSLEAAVQKLNDSNKQISVDYSAKGGNVNDALKAQLADLGFTDIDVKISEGGVAFKAEDDKATVGISDAQDKTNGDVTFFYIDPNDYTGYNIDGLRNADVAFELSRDGKTEYYLPNKSVQVAWDEAKLQDLLDSAAESLQIGYAAGESADGVTQNVTLPYKAGSAKKFSVEWTSSDTERLFVSGYSWEDKTGKVSRASSDRDVTLTAKVTVTSGDIKLAGSHDFKLAVKGDPEKVAADKKALQEKVDAAFTYDNIKYSGTDTVANKDGLTADLQMPRTSALNIDGKYYEVKYSASTDDITLNGYKGTVYQPLPGTEAAKTKITLTVTDKSNAEVTASKTLDFAIAPQDQDELDAELFLMEKAKAGYAAAILNGQEANAVSADMHAFQKAYLDADGNLAWSYNKTTTDSTDLGVVPVDLPGYDAMSGQDWRLFKSSNSSVVTAENLKVTQPRYNTKVTISSRLTSEKYARYAERYSGNATYAKLANQDVSATLTVLGTTGVEDPNAGKTIIVKAGVTGLTGNAGDSERSPESIVPLTQVPVQYDDHKTAEDVLEQVLENAGCTDFETNSLGLTSLRTKDGRILGSDWNAPYRYWSFYVNGAMADVGATQYAVQPGDTIEYRYFDGFAVLTHTVTFDAGEGSAVAAQKVEDGKAAARPEDPAREGYTFAGWYSDAGCTRAYDFSTPVSGDVTLYAKWTKDESATVSVVGVKNPEAATPVQDAWLNSVAVTYAAGSGATAWDLIRQALDAAGLAYDAPTESWGVFVKSITSAGGVELGTTADYSRSWGFYVNGESASEGVSSYKVKPGDSLSLVYLYNFKQPATEVDGVVVDPSAKGPDWSSSWPAAGTGATDAPTPTGAAEEKWVAKLKESSDWSTYVSEPITAGDYLFIAAGNSLYQRDAKTGDVVKSAKLVSAISSVSRMAYAGGLVLVPLGDGRVQALTADALTTVWVSEKLPDGKGGAQQCQGNLTVSAGKVYFQTSAGWSGPGGYSVCLDLATGRTIWKQQAVGTKANYYWTGMGVSGDYGFVGNMDGTVETVDLATGKSVSSLSLGASVRSGVTVAPGGKVIYVVSYDGYLHKLGVGTAGVLTELGRVAISNSGKDGKGAESFGPTSTPVLAGNRIYVGGVSADRAGKYGSYYGQLTVIDTDDMSVIASVSKTTTGYISGEVKSTPVVSQQGDATYVYFTGNNKPGALYRYKVGDAAAEEIYTPASANRDYGMCTPAVGADGTLYYINDSGSLFAIAGKEAPAVKTFTVRFDTGGGSAVADQAVDEGGGKAVKPADPEREGYTFDGWFADVDGTQPFDFDSAISSDVTVYAKWSKKEVPATISVTGSVAGVDAENKSQVWADKTTLELPEGATAADLSEALFERAGLVYDATPDTQYGWRLNSITSPDGRVLGTVDMGNNRCAYWSLVVNGEYAQLGASSIVLKGGDDVSWVYEVPEAPAIHTVTFDAGEGSAVAAQKVEDGKAAARPEDPAREGYTFAGWYSDAGCTRAYDFSTPVSGDVTLYAKWTKNAAKQITVSATLYGVDGDKMSQPWAGEASLAVDEGSTIQKVTERYFESLGIDYQLINLRPYGLGGVELYSVTSTVDGTVLANLSTSYWQAYVNGVRIDDSLDEAKLNSGDKLVWRYLVDSKRPAELVDGVVVEPDADRPVDSKSDATGFGNAVTNADTPTGATAEAWTFNYKQYVGGSYVNASEPVIVDGYIYLAVNDQLLKIDCQTGKVASSAKLKASVSYTARPVYAKGLVMVPLSGGSVQALTVDKLKTVWMTSAVSAEAQSSSSLTVDGDYLYIGTADGTRDITKFVNGFVVCIDIQSGKEVWRHHNANEGYYWTGGVAVDGKFVVPTSSGTVEVLDQKTGEVLGELSLGVTTNSSIVVSQDGKTMYLVTRDGKLHVISFDDSLRSEASLSEKTVDLGLTGCASIPTLLDNNTLLVGGEKGDSSALAIVDLKTMSVKFVSGSDGAALPAGGIKAAPLVSKQAEGTYVYFTVNSAQSDSKGNRISGGGVYRYKMGDAEATLAYDASGHNEYCDSPVVSDRYGNLYYINDSGTLFRLSDGINVVLAYGDGSSSSSAVFKGNKLLKPADPTREGYTFAGWYKDEACTEAYDFSAAVTADMTLYAKWVKNAVNPGGNGDSGSNGGSNGNAGGSGNDGNSGGGTNGQQPGGAVSPGQKPVSSTTTATETKDGEDSKKDSDKSDKKSDKKDDKSGKSDAGSSAATTARKSAAAPAQESGFNPLAIVGVAAGVIGLAIVGMFVFTKRR